jgi:MFS family permease
MSTTTKRKIGMVGIFALLLTNFAYMGTDLIIIPGFSEIFKHYADASVFVTNFIASGQQLGLVIGCLVAPLLMKHLSKKTIIVVSFAVFIVVATNTAIIDDANFVAAIRGISGLLVGIIYPTAVAFITELFRDDDKLRAKYLGWNQGSMAALGAIVFIISGLLLGAFGWKSMFLEFLVGVPIWVTLVIFLPKTPAEKFQHTSKPDKDAGQSDAPGEPSKIAFGKLILILLAFTVVQIFYGALVYEFSLYLAENYSIPIWMNGLLGAIKGVIGAICGFLIFVPIFSRAKRFTMVICFAAQAIAYFGLMIVFPSDLGALWFLFCYSFIGIAFGLSIPYYFTYSSYIFPKERMPLITSLLTIFWSVGSFLSTYYVTFLQWVLGTEAYTPVMPLIGLSCLAAAALSLFAALRDPDRKTAFENLQKQEED